MNRPDKKYNKLSVTERELGGIPNSSEDIKQAHASAIETYIEHFVGLKESGYGDVYFQRTLEDWAKFNINNRTKHDAYSSSNRTSLAPQSAFMMIFAASRERKPGSSKSSGFIKWSSIPGVATFLNVSGFTLAKSQ